MRDGPVVAELEQPLEGRRPSRGCCRGVSMTPLGSAVVPEVKTTSKSESRSGGGQASTWASQSAGKRVVRVGHELLELPDREVDEADLRRVRGVEAAVHDQPLRLRAVRDALDDPRRHAQVQRHDDDAGPHGAPVDGRQARRGGRPGQQAVAGLQAPRAQAPGRQQRAPPHLRGGPGQLQAVVGAQAPHGWLGRPAGGRVIEDGQERGVASRRRGSRSSREV